MTYPSGKQALQRLDLDLTSPSLVGLLGPNGAGKSTLMKLLVAALLPTQGSILVDGRPLDRSQRALKARLGYLPQSFGLYDELTVYQFLDYMAALKGLRNSRSAIDQVIRAVNLEEKRRARIRTLSGGQRQRVGIAQALLGDPEFLIFDEPTVGLDPEERIHFRNLFSQTAQDRLVLLSTHIIEDVQSVCGQLVVMDQGRVLFTGTPEALIQSAAGTVEGRAAYQFQNTSGQGWTVCFGVDPGYDITSARANGAEISPVRTGYEESNMALWEIALPADGAVELVLEYGGFPRDWNIAETTQGSPEISGAYLCLENQNLMPYLLNVLPEGQGYPTTVELTVPGSMTVIPFGTSEAEVVETHGNGTATWRYEDDSAGGIVYAGDYIRQDIQAGGATIQLYYGRKHQAVMEQAGAADAVRAVVDYCTEHYGPLSFSAGGSLKLIQSRVAGGGYAAGGASLLDEMDFTVANLRDGGKGAVPGEVMIHELVHQWWGLGNMFDSEDPADPWSAEGLTVYTTYRIVKELYGADHAQEYYVDQWKREVEDYYLDFYVRNPEYLAMLPEEEQLAITNSLTGMRQYCEMPLKILRAEKLVGGEAAMDEILRGLFNRELDWSYPYLTYQEFLDACGLTEEELDLGQDISI